MRASESQGSSSRLRVDQVHPHPALTLMPDMPQDQFLSLCESVRLNGIQEPIVVAGDTILDGRQRWRAAIECGRDSIPARKVELDELGQWLYIMRACGMRRHLSDDQRAIIGARMYEPLSLLMRAARARTAGKAGGRGRPSRGRE